MVYNMLLLCGFDGLYHCFKQLLIKKDKKAIFAHSPHLKALWMTGCKSLPLLQGVVLLHGCEESVLKDRAERRLRGQRASATETDRNIRAS